MALLLAFLSLIAVQCAVANTQLQQAETAVNVKPNNQLGDASVSFVRPNSCVSYGF